MRWTRAQLDEWRGREALDADAEPIGKIVATLVSEASGAPRWLALQTGAHGDDITPVPLAGAEPTGAAVRFPYPAATIRAAPHQPAAEDLSADQDRRLCSFYGLQPNGPPPRPQPPGGGPGVDAAVVSALRDAHALEREAQRRLRSLIKALDDDELRHDAARHLTETQGHAAVVAGRLEQLAAAPSSVRDALGFTAAIATPSAKATSDLLRDALAFERRECDAYAQLVATARGAGDEASAAIGEKIRADEEAMAETLASALRRMGAPS